MLFPKSTQLSNRRGREKNESCLCTQTFPRDLRECCCPAASSLISCLCWSRHKEPAPSPGGLWGGCAGWQSGRYVLREWDPGSAFWVGAQGSAAETQKTLAGHRPRGSQKLCGCAVPPGSPLGTLGSPLPPFPAAPSGKQELSTPLPAVHEALGAAPAPQACALLPASLPLLARFSCCFPRQGIALDTTWVVQPPPDPPQLAHQAGEPEPSPCVVGSVGRSRGDPGGTRGSEYAWQQPQRRRSRDFLLALSPLHPQPLPHAEQNSCKIKGKRGRKQKTPAAEEQKNQERREKRSSKTPPCV